jgi:serine/threonine protein kinase/tetratricopeptide (TPR) repeat protein
MIGETLGHYRIVERLGKGGMGEVFLAEDSKLRRKVALKVLPQELVHDTERKKRFLQEARAAAGIEHPNIAAVYDVDEDKGHTFIAMEYVRGESLRLTILRKLSPLRVVEIAIQVADALAKVHARGVVHRDLKPDNVIISEEGYPKLIDFGLAKLFEPDLFAENESEGETASVLKTRAGVVLGTVAYMSPEQARGEAVDARSDIFAFGVLLYEMLAGTAPFKRGSATETLSAILRDTPPPLRVETGPVPKALKDAIDRALAKNPDDRYQSFKDVVLDLTRVRDGFAGVWTPRRLPYVGSGIAAATLLAGVGWLFLREPPSVTAQEPLSVLVADFDNRTGNPLFDGALEQALAIGLEGASFITSYSRPDARIEGSRIDPTSGGRLDERLAQLVCRSSGIKVAVVGSVNEEAGTLSVQVKAIDPVSSGVIVEASKKRVAQADVLRAADDLSRKLRSGLSGRDSDSTAELEGETFATASLEAMKSYSEAQDLYKAGKMEEAIERYRTAISHDPEFGRAYSGIASVLANLGRAEEAQNHYELALSKIDRMTERERYRTRGAHYLFTRDPLKAVEEFSALVDKYPADTAGFANLALAHFYERDMVKAMEIGRRSLAIYPKNLLDRNNVALYALYAGAFETAETEADAVLALNPEYTKAYIALGLAQLGLGRPEDARASYDRLASQGRSAAAVSLSVMAKADLLMYQGEWQAALALLEQGIAGDRANDNAASRSVKLIAFAEAQLELGRETAARAAIEEAIGLTRRTSVLVPAARIYLALNEKVKADGLAKELEGKLQSDPRAYGKIIAGEILLVDGKTTAAIEALRAATTIADTWLGRFLLGRAYIEAGAFAEAHSELERCGKRRGEATAVFLDDIPSFRYFPATFYYAGIAQRGLKSLGAVESFERYLEIRGKSTDDRLVTDARRQVSSGFRAAP